MFIKTKIQISVVLFTLIYGATTYAFQEPSEVVLLSGVEINALSGPINLKSVLMKSEDGCHIYGEAGISPIDHRMMVRLKKKSCGNKSQSIDGYIVGSDGYKGLRIKCIDTYISLQRNNEICMVGQLEPGIKAMAVIE